MTYRETERLIRLLHRFGVYHFKTAEIEINLAAPTPTPPPALEYSPEPVKAELDLSSKLPEPEHTGRTAASAPPVEMPIPHHVNEVQNLLKLSDNDLVEKLFPDYSGPAKE